MYNESLNKLLALKGFLYDGAKELPQFIIYSETNNPRLQYTCGFIFHQAIISNFIITENKNEFLKSNQIKINYSSEIIPDTIHILPSGLLNETGIREFVPPVQGVGKSVLLFPNETELGYDIFSMVFYFISRYEEWQKFVKDNHGRFEVRNCLLYKLSSLQLPLIDIRMYEFRNFITLHVPSFQFKNRNYRYVSTIDVDNVFAFKGKPFLRNMGGAVKDLLRGNLIGVFQRFGTVFLNKKDPFDNYEMLDTLSRQRSIPLIYFFLYRNNTTFDRSIDPQHPVFTALLRKLIANGIEVGIHPSYFSGEDSELLSQEIKQFSLNTGKAVNLSRQHYLRFNIKTTPRDLYKQGIQFDFTMGFAGSAGYRAGTGLPFYYYDFSNEEELKIMAVPFAVMDGAYYVYSKTKLTDAKKEISEMAGLMKELNGLFITVFHERSFSELHYPGWKKLYIELQDTLSDLTCKT